MMREQGMVGWRRHRSPARRGIGVVGALVLALAATVTGLADGPSTNGLITVAATGVDFTTAEVTELPAAEVLVMYHTPSPGSGFRGWTIGGLAGSYGASVQRPLQASSDWWDWRVATRNNSASAKLDVVFSMPLSGSHGTFSITMGDAVVSAYEVFRGPGEVDYERIVIASLTVALSRK